jgi:hypothetical protein
MKKILIMLALLLMPLTVNAFQIDGFYKSFNVSLNCDECGDKDTREIKLKLFANGEEVDGTELILNKGNNFSGTFEDLPIFEDDYFTEIEYEVKFFEDGQYRSFNKSEISYNKETVSKWISVDPTDITPGERYVLLTDNWYHEYNGKDPFILLDGKMYHQYVDVIADYNIIDGKKSYYSLDSEPNEKTIWEVGTVPEDAHHYELYKDFLVFKNVHYDKNLTLIGEMGQGTNYYSWRVSSREGWQEDENAKYTGKVAVTPVENEPSRFTISSLNWWSESHITNRYLGIGHSVEVKAQEEEAYAAHFVAFKYVEDVEEEQVYNVHIDKVICKNLQDLRKIQLSDSVDVLGVFKDIEDISGIDFDVVDPTIVKVENGKVIPLKIGETDISFKYGFTDYLLHVIVYDDPNKNPYTNAENLVVILAVIIISGALFVLLNRKKKFLN